MSGRCFLLFLDCSLFRSVLVLELRDLFIDGRTLGFGIAPDVHDVGGFESPNEGLDPWNNGQETDPTHDIHCFGIRMLARDGDPARQTENKYQGNEERRTQYDKGCESDVVPEVELKT